MSILLRAPGIIRHCKLNIMQYAHGYLSKASNVLHMYSIHYTMNVTIIQLGLLDG